MKIGRGYRSDQVDDRRGQSAPRGGGGGLPGGGGLNLLSFLFRRFGVPGVVVGVGLLYLASSFGGAGGGGSDQGPATREDLAAEQPLVELVSFVFDDAQGTWSELLRREGKSYELARLVMFRDRTSSACGLGESAMGPFYCSRDRQVYIDLGFYTDLKQRLGAPGDFAQAYVIAHEVGHHVQNLLGVSDRVHRAAGSEQQGDEGLSVRLELQADCFAGLWAHSANERQLLDVGDLDEALNAAMSIGDDTLQKRSTGSVRPESFTHGSSVQRKRWFKRGYDTATLAACDTFNASAL
jgi:uncharacterized protein